MINEDAAEGPTFSLPIKLLASLLVGSLVLCGFRVADRMVAATWSANALGFMLAAAAVTVVCYYRMLGSRTAIDSEYIRQDFLWPKKVALADIIQAKFIHVPYMNWLITPRMAVRVRGRGFFVFYAGDERVLRAFARLSSSGCTGLTPQP